MAERRRTEGRRAGLCDNRKRRGKEGPVCGGCVAIHRVSLAEWREAGRPLVVCVCEMDQWFFPGEG